MTKYLRILSIIVTGCILTGIAVSPLKAAAETLMPEYIPTVDFSILPEDASSWTGLTYFDFSITENARINLTVECDNPDVQLTFGLHGEEPSADFNWRNTESLQYHGKQMQTTESNETSDIYYVLEKGRYYFWIEGLDSDGWDEPITGKVTLTGEEVTVNAPYKENTSRETAAPIETGVHYKSMITGELSHTDIIAGALSDQWFEFSAYEDGIYYFLGDLEFAADIEDTSNVIYVYKDGDSYSDFVINLETPATTEKNGRIITPMELTAGKYRVMVKRGVLNDGGIGYDFGIYKFTKGDANLDGSIGIDDATAVLGYYAQKAAGTDPVLTDSQDPYTELMAWLQGDASRYNWTASFTIEKDDVLDVGDATAILKYYADSACGAEPKWD
ncbi:MAG: hypothetical protein ACI4JN_03760 [Ruminococcus sp.]